MNKNRKKKRRGETGDSTEKASPSEHNIRTESKKKPKIELNMEMDTNTECTSDPQTPEDAIEKNICEDTLLSKEMKMMEKD